MTSNLLIWTTSFYLLLFVISCLLPLDLINWRLFKEYTESVNLASINRVLVQCPFTITTGNKKILIKFHLHLQFFILDKFPSWIKATVDFKAFRFYFLVLYHVIYWTRTKSGYRLSKASQFSFNFHRTSFLFRRRILIKWCMLMWFSSCDRMEGNSWQSGKKLTGHAFVPSRLSAIWIARELSRRGRNSRSVIEESARRDGGRGKMPLLLARARSAGDESSLDYRERAPICCLDSLLGCLSRYFCVFLRIFPSSISLLKGADYSRK